jgi:ABC-2 type transport system permease protein
MATLHLGAQLFGAVYFALRVPGFRAGPFLLAMVPHLFAAIFATALSAAIAGWVKRRAPSALLGISVLSLLVGLALVGFYQPAWRSVTMLNPITHGALALRHLDHLGPAVVLPSVLLLTALSAAVIAAGAAGVRRMEA